MRGKAFINHTLKADGIAQKASAFLDQARVICRRAERAMWELRERALPVSDAILQYLNRLSDLCWLYARYVETKSEAENPV